MYTLALQGQLNKKKKSNSEHIFLTTAAQASALTLLELLQCSDALGNGRESGRLPNLRLDTNK